MFFLLFSASCTKDVSVKKGSTSYALTIDAKTGLSKESAVIKTVHGNIIFKFYLKQAPKTSKRIAELIESGFYNNLIFHRVIPNFVIQGGDPEGTGQGGSGQKLQAEFNKIQHVKGTVAMARAQDIHSADSQFYIALSSLPHLNEKYTVFGKVIKGINILDKVKKNDKILNMKLNRKVK